MYRLTSLLAINTDQPENAQREATDRPEAISLANTRHHGGQRSHRIVDGLLRLQGVAALVAISIGIPLAEAASGRVRRSSGSTAAMCASGDASCSGGRGEGAAAYVAQQLELPSTTSSTAHLPTPAITKGSIADGAEADSSLENPLVWVGIGAGSALLLVLIIVYMIRRRHLELLRQDAERRAGYKMNGIAQREAGQSVPGTFKTAAMSPPQKIVQSVVYSPANQQPVERWNPPNITRNDNEWSLDGIVPSVNVERQQPVKVNAERQQPVNAERLHPANLERLHPANLERQQLVNADRQQPVNPVASPRMQRQRSASMSSPVTPTSDIGRTLGNASEHIKVSTPSSQAQNTVDQQSGLPPVRPRPQRPDVDQRPRPASLDAPMPQPKLPVMGMKAGSSGSMVRSPTPKQQHVGRQQLPRIAQSGVVAESGGSNAQSAESGNATKAASSDNNIPRSTSNHGQIGSRQPLEYIPHQRAVVGYRSESEAPPPVAPRPGGFAFNLQIPQQKSNAIPAPVVQRDAVPAAPPPVPRQPYSNGPLASSSNNGQLVQKISSSGSSNASNGSKASPIRPKGSTIISSRPHNAATGESALSDETMVDRPEPFSSNTFNGQLADGNSSNGSHISKGRTVITRQNVMAMPGYMEMFNGKDFTIGKELARGGGGAVYIGTTTNQDAIRLANSSTIVVKRVFVDAGDEHEARISFEQEVSIMSFFRDERNIARLVGFCWQPLILLMKFYPCGSLSDLLYKQNSKPALQSVIYTDRLALQLAIDVACALVAIHREGLMHSDLKPQNVLLDRDEQGALFALITDFGVTQIVSSKALLVKAFKVSSTAGSSPCYAAPEVLDESQPVSRDPILLQSGDVFSFAVILAEVITRRPPWVRFTRVQEILKVVSRGARGYPSPFQCGPLEHHRRISGIVSRCWDQAPRARPQILAVYHELLQVIAGMKV